MSEAVWTGFFCTLPTFDSDGVQVSSGIDDEGREHPDPVPLRPAVPFEDRDTMEARVRRLVQSELMMRWLDSAGVETFEEADDFDVEDDPLDPHTPYEMDFDPMGSGDRRAAPSADAPAAGGDAAPPSPTSDGEFEQQQPNVKRSVSNEPGANDGAPDNSRPTGADNRDRTTQANPKRAT